MSQTKIDLLVQGGWVIDPANGHSGVADVALLKGRVSQVAENIDPSLAAKVHDASGKIVCPGLIDAHTHVADAMMPVSIDPDLAGLPTGVTTVVDAGSAGARTFAGFRKHIISRAQTRVFAFLNISSIGLVVTNELYLDPKLLGPKRASRIARENRDLIIGIKARIQGTEETLKYDINVMEKSLRVAADLELPVMMHWTNLPELLDMLRPGDLLTHPYSPAYYGPRCIDDDGQVLPQAINARERGVLIDLGHGSSFEWAVAESAAKQSFFPDLLSTDMFYRYYGPKGVVENLPAVMSKFLYLGMPIEDVIRRVTELPAKSYGLPDGLGTLSPGAIADLTILEQRSGTFELMDSPKLRQTRTASEKLFPISVIKSGRLIDCP